MSYETITYEVRDHVATITLNRPEKLNSIGVDMIHDLVAAIQRIDGDDDVRCAVVTGAGRAFCAGADLSKREDTFVVDKYDDEFVAARDGARAVALALYDSPKPFVAAINGSAVGFGLTLTLPMDIRICADNAKLGFVFSRRGMIIDAAASWFLPRIVSLSWAADWAYSGRMFSADEALRAGLVRELHPAEAVLPAAYAIAAEIAAASPVSVSFTKALLWRASMAPSPLLALDLDSAALRELGTRPDCAEGVQAFLERRPARFTSKVSTDMPAAYGWWQRDDDGG